MFNTRFNHVAASEAARELARLLHVRRLRLSLQGIFDDLDTRPDVDRKVAELQLRESALHHFADDPYHADALLRIFHAEDRATVLDAGRPQAGSGMLPAAA